MYQHIYIDHNRTNELTSLPGSNIYQREIKEALCIKRKVAAINSYKEENIVLYIVDKTILVNIRLSDTVIIIFSHTNKRSINRL